MAMGCERCWLLLDCCGRRCDNRKETTAATASRPDCCGGQRHWHREQRCQHCGPCCRSQTTSDRRRAHLYRRNSSQRRPAASDGIAVAAASAASISADSPPAAGADDGEGRDAEDERIASASSGVVAMGRPLRPRGAAADDVPLAAAEPSGKPLLEAWDACSRTVDAGQPALPASRRRHNHSCRPAVGRSDVALHSASCSSPSSVQLQTQRLRSRGAAEARCQ